MVDVCLLNFTRFQVDLIDWLILFGGGCCSCCQR